jgi:hypothetical protein
MARKYDSSLEAAVTGNNSIPTAVYDNLVNSVNSNLDYLHRYVSLRKQVMKVDKIHYYDMYTNLVDDFEMTVKYDDAVKKVKEALKPMGKDYMSNVDKAFAGEWIDAYETQNNTDRRCTGVHFRGTRPTSGIRFRPMLSARTRAASRQRALPEQTLRSLKTWTESRPKENNRPRIRFAAIRCIEVTRYKEKRVQRKTI